LISVHSHCCPNGHASFGISVGGGWIGLFAVDGGGACGTGCVDQNDIFFVVGDQRSWDWYLGKWWNRVRMKAWYGMKNEWEKKREKKF